MSSSEGRQSLSSSSRSGSTRSRDRDDDDRDRYRKDDRHHRDRNRDKHDRYRYRSRSRSRDRDRRRSRSRSREDRRKTKEVAEPDTRVREMSISPAKDVDDDDRIPTPPPAPRITKISIGFNKPAQKTAAPIKMKLGAPPTQTTATKVIPKPAKVASVFNDGSDEEPEEMPAEARMRMRNIGRDTPTSSGPNSFGKTKQGFCDPKGMLIKNMKEAMDDAPPPKSSYKFPTTVYKL